MSTPECFRSRGYVPRGRGNRLEDCDYRSYVAITLRVGEADGIFVAHGCKPWEQDHPNTRAVEDGGIIYTVYSDFMSPSPTVRINSSRHVPHLAMWATNISPSSTVQSR